MPFDVSLGAIPGGRVGVVSYPAEAGPPQAEQDRCTVTERFARRIALDCAVPPGAAGAPIFVTERNRGRVLAVVSGLGVPQRDRVVFGTELAVVVAGLRARLAPSATPGKARVRRLVGGEEAPPSGAKFVRP